MWLAAWLIVFWLTASRSLEEVLPGLAIVPPETWGGFSESVAGPLQRLVLAEAVAIGGNPPPVPVTKWARAWPVSPRPLLVAEEGRDEIRRVGFLAIWLSAR